MLRLHTRGIIVGTVALTLALGSMPVEGSAETESVASPSPAPGRLEVAELGIAVTFPDEWYVEYEGPTQLVEEEMMGSIHSLPAGLLGPDDTAWYLAYGRSDLPGECAIQFYETSELTSRRSSISTGAMSPPTEARPTRSPRWCGATIWLRRGCRPRGQRDPAVGR